MKKSRVVANIIIAVMIISLVALTFSNVASTQVSGDTRVVYSGNTNSKNVCFMINVYEGNENVKAMLDVMDLYNVKTTFFVGGCWAVNNLDMVKEIYARGHEIGNHGFYHRDHDTLDFDANVQEIKMCHEVLSKNLGLEMTLFAPPSGAYDVTTVDAAESLGYKTIMWTHDTIDWRDKDSNIIFKRATINLSGGDLILMHPTKQTVDAFANILAYAMNNDFNPTTVSACLAN